MNLINLPEEILDHICINLSLKELCPFLHIPKLRKVAKKKIFHIVRFEDSSQYPPKSAWKWVKRLECFNVKFSEIQKAISCYPNLQQLVLDDECKKDSGSDLILPKVHTLILGNSMSSDLILPHFKFKLLAFTVNDNNWPSLRYTYAKTLHITIESCEAFVNILPYLECEELYIYGEDYCEKLSQSESISSNWNTLKKFDSLNLCGVLPSGFVSDLLKYTASKILTLELIEISGKWKNALSNHPNVQVLIHEDSIIEDLWTCPIDTLYINGNLIVEAAFLCNWAKRIVFDKCLTGILQDNLRLLLQQVDIEKSLETIVFKNYDATIPRLDFPIKCFNYQLDGVKSK